MKIGRYLSCVRIRLLNYCRNYFTSDEPVQNWFDGTTVLDVVGRSLEYQLRHKDVNSFDPRSSAHERSNRPSIALTTKPSIRGLKVQPAPPLPNNMGI